MTPLQEIVSVTLEVIAFFFVTTELYGKKNLEMLSNRTSSAADDIQIRIAKYIDEKLLSSKAPLGNWTYSQLFGGVRGFRLAVLVMYAPIVAVYIWWCIYAFRSAPYQIVLIVGLAVPVGYAAFLVLTYVVSGLASIAERLLKIAGFKGVLLGIGTALFLLSKGMAWFAAVQELLAEH